MFSELILGLQRC